MVHSAASYPEAQNVLWLMRGVGGCLFGRPSDVETDVSTDVKIANII